MKNSFEIASFWQFSQPSQNFTVGESYFQAPPIPIAIACFKRHFHIFVKKNGSAALLFLRLSFFFFLGEKKFFSPKNSGGKISPPRTHGHTFKEMTTRVSGDILFCFMVKNIFLFFNKIILQKLWLSFP